MLPDRQTLLYHADRIYAACSNITRICNALEAIVPDVQFVDISRNAVRDSIELIEMLHTGRLRFPIYGEDNMSRHLRRVEALIDDANRYIGSCRFSLHWKALRCP